MAGVPLRQDMGWSLNTIELIFLSPKSIIDMVLGVIEEIII